MTQQLLPFLFLNLAGIFVIIYMLLQRDKRFNSIEVPTVELTPNFMDIQERITSEAEATRKQQDSHYKNNQTAIKTLAGAVKKLPSEDFVVDHLDRESENMIGNAKLFIEESEGRTADLITDEHKKTRRRIAEVKTRLADEERDDQRAKAAARRFARKMGSESDVLIEADSTLPEGTMVLRDDESGDEVTISNVKPESLVKAAKKVSKPKKKHKASK